MSQSIDDAKARKAALAVYLQGFGIDPRHLELADDLWGLDDWSDDDVLDLALAADAEFGPASPGETVALSHDGTTISWVQSALAAALDPRLPSSGRLDAATRLGLQVIQANAARLGIQVQPTGALDGPTLAALELLTGTKRPADARPEWNLRDQPLLIRDKVIMAVVKVETPSGPSNAGRFKVLPMGGKQLFAKPSSSGKVVSMRPTLDLTLGTPAPAATPSAAPSAAPPAPTSPGAGSVGAAAIKPTVMSSLLSSSAFSAAAIRSVAGGGAAAASPAVSAAAAAAAPPPPAPPKPMSAPAGTPWLKGQGFVLSVSKDQLVLASKLRDYFGQRGTGTGGGAAPNDSAPETPTHSDPPSPTEPGPAVDLADTGTRERWAQSVLRALVAPQLVVDGIFGPRSRAALGAFQSRLPEFIAGAERMEPTGDLTAAVMDALGTAIGAPWQPGELGTSGGDPTLADAPPTGSSLPGVEDLPRVQATTQTDSQGLVWQVVRLDGDEVRFRFRVKERQQPDGQTVDDPYNVWAYEGAKTNLLSDADIASVGYSSSGIKILKANALKESAGKFGAINTWDNQFVSWGLAQFAGHAGTLANVMTHLKEGAASAQAFARFFLANGIDVEFGPYPYYDRNKREMVSRTGWHVVVVDDSHCEHRGDVGWLFLRTQPALIGAFMLAGNDKSIQLGQLSYWKWKFFDSAVNRTMFDNSGRYRAYCTSELGVGLGVRLFNWMPAFLRTWFEEITTQLNGTVGTGDLKLPANWNAQVEAAFVEAMKTRRRNAKSGSWDTYGPELSSSRSSYVG